MSEKGYRFRKLNGGTYGSTDTDFVSAVIDLWQDIGPGGSLGQSQVPHINVNLWNENGDEIEVGLIAIGKDAIEEAKRTKSVQPIIDDFDEQLARRGVFIPLEKLMTVVSIPGFYISGEVETP